MAHENLDNPLQDRRLILAARGEANQLNEAMRTAIVHDEDEAVCPDLPGYDIVRELHRGTQGVVYLAIQRSTQRKVAIKVLRESRFAGAHDVSRFQREVHLLGRLRHPSIVAVHDSGETDGCFYHVMDYVSGRPLDAYVRERDLGIDEIVALFATVCEAVNAAHLLGIIHRDLKPSNVLVDDDGRPHVLDFGLAKIAAVGDAGGGHTVMTVAGQFVGSLQWASPEQARGHSDDVDIRSDVYSIGVMLYTSLVGCFPYDVTGSIGDVLGRISDDESTRLRTVRRDVPGEVETIVLKCLSKDRERRYQNAGELARDLRRYLAGEPIEAKRDSTWYVLRKAIRRHRVAAAIAAAFIVVVASGLAGTISNARIANRQREAAEEQRDNALAVAGFLKEMLGLADPAVTEAQERSIQDMLDLAVPMVDEHFENQPLLEADVRHTLGKTYFAAGEFDKANEQINRALDLYERHGQLDSPDPHRIRMTLAWLQNSSFQGAESRRTAEEAIEGLTRTLGPRHPDTLRAHAFIGMTDPPLSRPNDFARSILEQTLAAQREVLDPDDPDIAFTMEELAERLMFYQQEQENERAERLLSEALVIYTEVLGPDHPRTILGKRALARFYTYTLRFEEALDLHRQVYEIRRERFGDHIQTARALKQLAWTYAIMGRYDVAEPQWRRAFDMLKPKYGADMPRNYLLSLAYGKIRNGDLAGAETLLDEYDHDSSSSLPLRAMIALERDEPVKAERLLRPVSDQESDESVPLLLGEALRMQSKYEEAECFLLRSWPQYHQADHHARNLRALLNLVLLYEQWNAATPTPERADSAARWRARYNAYREKLERGGVRIQDELRIDS